MPQPQWTVSIIAQFTEKDEFARICYDLLIRSIKQHRNPNVNFYILKYHKENEVTEFIAYDLVSEDSDRVEHITCPKSTENFYKSPAVMIEFFKDFPLQYQDRHHFLISWGHGIGFGLFGEGDLPELLTRFVDKQKEKFAPGKELKDKIVNAMLFFNRMLSSGAIDLPPVEAMTETFKTFLEKNDVFFLDQAELRKLLTDYFRMVTMQRFVDAIANSFGAAGVKVDFMYSMNCYMQLFETGYLLQDHVEYFGSAEGFQFFSGPDYDALFNELGTTYAVPQPDLDTLSASIIHHHNLKYCREDVIDMLVASSHSRDRDVVLQQISEVCVAITRPSLYGTLRTKINELAGLLENNNGRLFPTIREARKRCEWVSSTNYGIIDLAHFCTELLLENVPDRHLSDCLHAVIAAIVTSGQVVAAIKDAPSLCEPIITRTGPKPTVCPHGISIFFPKHHNSESDAEYVHYFMDNIYRQPYGSSDDTSGRGPSWKKFVISYFASDMPAD